MEKAKFKLTSLILSTVIVLTSFFSTPSAGIDANADSGNSKTVKAGKTVTIVQEKGMPYSLFWTAPKTGYFNFSFTNRKSTKDGEKYYMPRCKITIKLDGKKEAVYDDYGTLMEQTGNGQESMYFNCNKGTKVEITYKPEDNYCTLTSDFKLNFTSPKYAVGLKNKSRKTATKIKLNKKYTTVAKQDPIYYTRNSNKFSIYGSLKMINLNQFNKYSGKFDLDWYEFKAPKNGDYRFTTPSTVSTFVTNSKGKSYMGGSSHEYSNKKKLQQYLHMKKGEKAYFAVIPNGLNVPDKTKTFGTKCIEDGYLYTVQIKRKK